MKESQQDAITRVIMMILGASLIGLKMGMLVGIGIFILIWSLQDQKQSKEWE